MSTPSPRSSFFAKNCCFSKVIAEWDDWTVCSVILATFPRGLKFHKIPYDLARKHSRSKIGSILGIYRHCGRSTSTRCRDYDDDDGDEEEEEDDDDHHHDDDDDHDHDHDDARPRCTMHDARPRPRCTMHDAR